MVSLFDRAWEQFKCVILCRPPRQELRTIYINHLNIECLDENGQPTKGQTEWFPSNMVNTAQYDVITFLPRNLTEQLLRLPNMYFLVACIIQLCTDTPVSKVASILPLAFVILVTMVKQGYEDLLRHLEDRKVNQTLVWVVKDGKSELIASKLLQVGDLVKVFRNESFPCDLLFLSGAEQSGECLVTTANLDGETNLKAFWAVEDTKQLRNSILLCSEVQGKLVCEQPKADLYNFAGALHLCKPKLSIIPVAASNLLLRGAVLRNTNFVYGLAVYTGPETKVGLNSRGCRSKHSVIDSRLNRYLLVLICILLLLTIATAVGSIVASRMKPIADAWFLPGKELQRFNLQDALNALIILHYIIPISLLVTIEIQKFLSSMFIDKDVEMYYNSPHDPNMSNWAKTNTSEIIEELGAVDHIFCDKTGTLTENVMTFRGCSMSEVKYLLKGHSLIACKTGKSQVGPAELEFLTHLAICHTARAQINSNGKYVYQASSPDEKALLDGCRRLGVIFKGKKDNQVIVSINGRLAEYQMIQVLEFDNTRRRMSVIITDPMGVFWMISKGADSAMLPRCVSGDREATVKFISQFSAEGLRVLVVGRKRMVKEEAEKLNSKLREAASQVIDRESRMAEVINAAEDGFQLLGCTAVEDELQTGVPETIRDMRAAGIRVWVLTGDKVETAENISLSAGHTTVDMRRIRIVGCRTRLEVESALNLAERQVTESSENYSLVLDGDSLWMLTDWGSDHRDLCQRFLKIADGTSAVLCCRCTPLQKSRTVAAVKSASAAAGKRLVTCAIGDGANDVSMIKEAHVGVGLYGKEGRAAALNADYCLARFRFLRKLLLFHGHLFYYRISMMVQYFFYKNMVFTLPQFYYTFFTGFSMISIYDSFFLAAYNAVLTALPILVFGVLEQHLPRSRLYREPGLYSAGKAADPMSWSSFATWMAISVWHSIVCFGVNAAVFLVNSDIGTPGSTGFGRTAFGTIVVECILLVVHAKLALCTRFFNVFAVFGLAVSIFCYPVFASYYNCAYTQMFDENFAFYWMFFELHQQPTTWALLFGVTCLALIPDFIIRIWHKDPLLDKHGNIVVSDEEEQHAPESEFTPSTMSTVSHTTPVNNTSL